MTSPASSKQPTTQRPFKKLFCHWRGRIFVDLKGARLAVWLYHYLRSNKEDQAWPSIAVVSRETGLHRDTVIEARKYLFAHGWLVKIEDTRFKTRRVAATFPVNQSEIPTSDDKKVGNSDQCQSEIPDTGKFRHEVDSSSEVEKQKRYDTALHAAMSAFRLFQQDVDDETAFKLVLWILYRAASVKAGAQIPETVEYYLTAKENLNMQQVPFGWETMIEDAAVRGFNARARKLVEEKSPELLAWLQDKAETLIAIA